MKVLSLLFARALLERAEGQPHPVALSVEGH